MFLKKVKMFLKCSWIVLELFWKFHWPPCIMFCRHHVPSLSCSVIAMFRRYHFSSLLLFVVSFTRHSNFLPLLFTVITMYRHFCFPSFSIFLLFPFSNISILRHVLRPQSNISVAYSYTYSYTHLTESSTF